MSKKGIHSLITISLAVLFTISLVWTFNIRSTNNELVDQNERLDSTVVNLLDVNKFIQSQYLREIDSIRAVNVELEAKVADFKKQLDVIVSREKNIITKYKTIYEKIKSDSTDAFQLAVLDELLARNTELAEDQ